MRNPAWLVLSDGAQFEGEAAGALRASMVAEGEVVFNTTHSGYQEVITDPSYAGQFITFTYPHIGNYGVSALDDESTQPWCSGVIVRELSAYSSNWRSVDTLENYLSARAIPILTGVDTRALTRHLREHGALAGAMGTSLDDVRRAASRAQGTDGRDLVSVVSTREPYRVGDEGPHVVCVDYGVKTTMIRKLSERFRLTVVPSSLSAQDIMSMQPDGLFLSNGPGDPAALDGPTQVVGDLVGRVPIFGICLGHQLLGRALGARTLKLPFGHHGSNHPVRDEMTGRIEITAQNHNYAVDDASLARVTVTHRNLNDGVVEGFRSSEEKCLSVQYHPEAGPGPHDARYLFERFERMIEQKEWY